MKWIKRLGIAILALPFILLIIWGLYEIFGMCVNRLAAEKQTGTLQTNLKNEISDIEIISVYSETGNTSGTGNHVDCLSSVTFSTKMQKSEIEDRLSEYYVFNNWGCSLDQTDDGYYVIELNTSAPFSDNIEGH